MKKTALLILATATLSCCKKGRNDEDALKNKLVYKWEIRMTIGGVAGVNYAEPGNGNMLEFKSDNSFTRYHQGNITRSGTYHLVSTSEKDKYRITFRTNTNTESQNVTLRGDTLALDFLETFTAIYVKIN
jgi:hypothetical protein